MKNGKTEPTDATKARAARSAIVKALPRRYNTERTEGKNSGRRGRGGGGKMVVMRDAKEMLNQKHGVVSADHTCSQCLHPAAAVAVIN